MKVLYLEWNSFGNEDMFAVLQDRGDQVTRVPFAGQDLPEEELESLLEPYARQTDYDYLFSFNYYPNVSNVSQKLAVKYVSWVYDSPYLPVYSYTVLNSCNFIFLFDYAVYHELHTAGIPNVYYLPLAVNEKRLADLQNTVERQKKYASEISFVGSLYTEAKHRLYDKFQNISPYARGYLDGMIQAQLQVQGYNFLQELISDEVLTELQKAYPTDPNATTVLPPKAIYADYVLARQVTAIERQKVLGMLAKQYPVRLYTYDEKATLAGVENCGMIDYYDAMPYVFLNSKINLNITLRSIKTGIPLRAFDIMGSGGFLLSNYQEELLQYFEPDQDFVYYSDMDDLMEKAEYYLSHEKLRCEIAANGCEKVRTLHTLEKRIEEMQKNIKKP